MFEDTAEDGSFLESFYLSSWLEHLRQHDRVMQADKALQGRVNAFHVGDGPPVVTHHIAAEGWVRDD